MAFTFLNLEEANKCTLEFVINQVHDVKASRVIPYISSENVNNYTRSDHYTGSEVNAYKKLKFINTKYHHVDIYDRFLSETLDKLIDVPYFDLLNGFIEDLIFYKFEIPEVFEFKLRKIKRIVGEGSIEQIIERIQNSRTKKYSKPKYDKYNVNKLLYNLNKTYELESSINYLLRDYIIKTIDHTREDNLYPNPFKIRLVDSKQIYKSRISGIGYPDKYLHQIEMKRIDDAIDLELYKIYGSNYNVRIYDHCIYKRYLYD